MNKNISLTLLIVLVLVGGVWWYRQRSQSLVTPSPTATLSTEPTSSPSTSPSITFIPTSTTPRPGRTLVPSDAPNLSETLHGVATCQLNGEIKFINHDLYNNQDARFRYQGVDHPARLVTWTVTPKDDLRVGPNIFNQLSLPNGESQLYISLPDQPMAQSYTLTATINYGRTVNGEFMIYTVACTGQTKITLP